jgi:hypothetical protein
MRNIRNSKKHDIFQYIYMSDIRPMSDIRHISDIRPYMSYCHIGHFQNPSNRGCPSVYIYFLLKF